MYKLRPLVRTGTISTCLIDIVYVKPTISISILKIIKIHPYNDFYINLNSTQSTLNYDTILSYNHINNKFGQVA